MNLIHTTYIIFAATTTLLASKYTKKIEYLSESEADSVFNTLNSYTEFIYWCPECIDESMIYECKPFKSPRIQKFRARNDKYLVLIDSSIIEPRFIFAKNSNEEFYNNIADLAHLNTFNTPLFISEKDCKKELTTKKEKYIEKFGCPRGSKWTKTANPNIFLSAQYSKKIEYYLNTGYPVYRLWYSEKATNDNTCQFNDYNIYLNCIDISIGEREHNLEPLNPDDPLYSVLQSFCFDSNSNNDNHSKP